MDFCAPDPTEPLDGVVNVRRLGPHDPARGAVLARWGESMAVGGRCVDLRTVDALAATRGSVVVGAVTYLPGEPLVIVSCDAFVPGQGVGRRLVENLVLLRSPRQVLTTTTNDNLTALAFWQRLGFRLVALRPGAVDAARVVKPAIARHGESGIAVHDELDLVLDVDTRDL